ncbi:hypothetical protein [Paenibacillus xylanexedens]|uniref:hypothetical protein n=1 Tax=Paenibacillus sp. FSL R7-0272 TaxID=2921679 RepID=UPI0012B6C0F6|nr:hypothetical protein [Paenibacillus xylanexedens]
MSKDHMIRSMLSENVNMTSNGCIADQLNLEEFAECYELFFDKIMEIHVSELKGIEGYGEFDEECRTEYGSCKEFLIGTFAEHQEGRR